MKEFFQILRRFVPPYKKFLILNILSNVLSAILNIFSFSLIIPILQILFKLSDQVYKFIPWDADMSMKKIALNNFYYYVTELIKTYGPSKTLLILGLFLSIMTFMKTGASILTFATLLPICLGVVCDLRG